MTVGRRSAQWRAWAWEHQELGLLGVFAGPGSLAMTATGAPTNGIRTLTFATREAARAALSPRQAEEGRRSDSWRYWTKVRVVPVTVTVKR